MTPDPLVAPVVGGTPEWEELRLMAWPEARRRHINNSDAEGFGASDGHKNLFKKCPHHDCSLVQAALVPRPEPRQIADDPYYQSHVWKNRHCTACGVSLDLFEAARWTCAKFAAEFKRIVPRPETREPEPPVRFTTTTVSSVGASPGNLSTMGIGPFSAAVRPASALSSRYPIRAHVEGCPKALRVPVDLCECGGRDVTPDPSASAPSLEQYRQSFACCEVHTPDLWEGDGTCVICEAVELDNRLKLAVADRNHAVARQAELETRIAELEAASAPSRPLEERSMAESPKLQVFSQAQLAEAVHQALAHELPAGHTSAIVGTVDAQGVQMVIGVQKAVGVGTFTTEFVARHDWTGGNELGARVLYSW